MKMFDYRKYSVWLAVVMLFLSGCERRPLEDYLRIKAKIPVKVFWDRAGLKAQNATVMVYREDGSLYLEKGFGCHLEYAETEIDLEVGTYTVFVFNELRDQIDCVCMRGWEKLSTFEAFATPAATIYETSQEEVKIVDQPGGLAVSKSVIEVTKEMVSHSGFVACAEIPNDGESNALDSMFLALTDLHPELKIATVEIKAHIKGLNNARMPALAELRNMAENYTFATDCNSKIPVTTQFLISNRVYDPYSLTDGTISATITSMGVCGNRFTITDTPENKIHLDLLFQLVDAERTEIRLSHDVTNILEIESNENHQITIYIEFDMGALPDVKPEGSEDAGFSADNAEWEGIDVPVYI